jgi:hypothetical protein
LKSSQLPTRTDLRRTWLFYHGRFICMCLFDFGCGSRLLAKKKRSPPTASIPAAHLCTTWTDKAHAGSTLLPSTSSSASRPPRTVSFGTKKKHPATIFDQRLEFTRQHRRVGSPPSLDKESTRHQESRFRGLLETRRRTLHWFTEETVNGLQKEQLSFVGNRLSRNCDANPDRMLSFQTTFHPLRISLLWTLLNTMQMV